MRKPMLFMKIGSNKGSFIKSEDTSTKGILNLLEYIAAYLCHRAGKCSSQFDC